MSVCCRICLEEEDERDMSKLCSPCDCKGSSKWVHCDCIIKWAILSRQRQCSVCRYEWVDAGVVLTTEPRQPPVRVFVFTELNIERMEFDLYVLLRLLRRTSITRIALVTILVLFCFRKSLFV